MRLLHLFIILGITSQLLRAQTAIQTGEKVTYLDETGKVVNSGMYKRGTSFSEGLAAVDASHDGESPKWFFINSEFKVHIPYGYDSVGLFKDGLCPVLKNGVWFYIGTNGLAAMDGEYIEAGNFHQGYAIVKSYNGAHIIDTKGNRIGVGYYKEISSLGDSCFGAIGKADAYWSLFHFNGDTLLKDSFYLVAPSVSGPVLVNRLGGYRFVNLKGEIQFGRAFLEATAYSNGWTSIRMENQWYLMDRKGKVKKGLRLKAPVQMQEPLTPALNYNGKYGALNLKGEWVF